MSKRSNGEGTFTTLDNGKVEMRKMIGYKSNGKPNIKKVRGTSKRDCLEKMKLKEKALGKVNDCNSVIKKWTVADLCNMHWQEDSRKIGKLKSSSVDRREVTIKNQIENYPIGGLNAISVRSQDIVNHIELLIGRDYSVSTVTKTLNVLNAAYKWANKNEYFKVNPCTKEFEDLKDRLEKLEKRNSSDGVVIVLSEEQSEQLKKYVKILRCNYTYKYIFGLSMVLLLSTGMRVGELCALRWKDWSSGTNTLSITKTRLWVRNRENELPRNIVIENEIKNYQSRTIVLSPDASSVIEEIYRVTSKKNPDDYIFLGRTQKPSNPKNYDQKISDYYSDMGMPSNISGAHILRRTCATNMHFAGCSIEDIASYLGDTPETILKHYICLTKKLVAGTEVLNAVPYPTKK